MNLAPLVKRRPQLMSLEMGFNVHAVFSEPKRRYPDALLDFLIIHLEIRHKRFPILKPLIFLMVCCVILDACGLCFFQYRELGFVRIQLGFRQRAMDRRWTWSDEIV
ncbi:hypothetical protein SLE2022_178140 [Rubroshorea leprosula]